MSKIPRGGGQPPPADTGQVLGGVFGTLAQLLGDSWHTVVRWIRDNTFTPSWLSLSWRRPWTGYLVAVLVQITTFLLTLLLVRVYPGFPFPSVLALVGIVLVALTFGGGPSLLATALAAILIDGVVVPKNSSWPLDSFENGVAVALLIVAGAIVSVVASRSERARHDAESAARDRSAFLDLAAHELKTPLALIQGSAHLLTRRFRQAATAKSMARDRSTFIEEAQPVLTRIEVGTERMDHLVEEMLTFAAMQAGMLELRRSPCALGPIVRKAVHDQREQHAQRSILLEVPDVPITVVADADRIGQVVTEYVSNALKFAPEDSPVTVRLEESGDHARVSVHDAGPGLVPTDQERVWEAFYRAPGVEVQSGSRIGLGVGLSICHAIVAGHGGRTGVASTVGQGSTFWFTLPLAPQAASAANPSPAG